MIVFAIVGVCAVLYGGWHMYQQDVAEDEHRSGCFHSTSTDQAFQTFSTLHRARHPRSRRYQSRLKWRGIVSMNDFNDIVAQFYTAGAKYSAGIQPYAIKLFLRSAADRHSCNVDSVHG